ncbi:hypothetical protein Hena1_02430 [Erwinia phage Hena1]|uniref:Uncharacterized protein n=1 Tax=Erwinia phage Hena1 TaxID=2678601 RepID=A0A6B9J9Z6_9CAUD|nr:hypothetical protein HWC84_gp121 [Erwinia phage Hena1]QGZ16393.1 hypothetical protein Hena1_02430 [Erwinia phage Hena1]
MLIKVVESEYMMTLVTFDCNGTYHLPRVGEYVTVDCRLYKVVKITHNLNDMIATVSVESK